MSGQAKWYCSVCKIWFTEKEAYYRSDAPWQHMHPTCMDKGDWNRMKSDK